jgi:tetratricopeptide (TPR) repeat protein
MAMCRDWFRLLSLFCACVLFSAPQGKATTPDDQLNAALEAWRTGDTAGAEEKLSEMIDGGSDDARIYYYRGILAEQTGKNGDADFESAAFLETRWSQTRAVNRALERTQGALRTRIERFRAAARNELKSDPAAAQRTTLYRDALAARSEGDLKTALEKFELLTATGTDPRYFYMHGVALAEAGEEEKAKAAFELGLQHEITPQHIKLVNLALADVQGDIRRLIEEETRIESGAEVITRQSNHQAILRRSQMTEEQYLSEVNAASRIAKEQQAATEQARRVAVADRLRAAREAREELASRLQELTAPTAPPAAAVASNDTTEPPPEPTTAIPAAPTDSSNPFLGGAAVAPTVTTSSGSSSSPLPSVPVDMSYLPEATEYLMYVRPAELLNSGFMKPLTDTPQFQQQLQTMQQQMNFSPSDIESVTMGMANLMATMTPVMIQAGSGQQPDPVALQAQLMGGENTLMVIRLVSDVDIAAAMSTAGSSSKDLNGKTLYVLPRPDQNQPQMTLHAVDGKTFLIGSEPAVSAAMENGPGETNRENFAFVSAANHMVQAFHSPMLAGMSGSIPDPPPSAPPFAAQLAAAVKGKISGAAFSFHASENLKVDISVSLTEPEAATEAGKALAGAVQMGTQMAPLMMGSLPQPLQAPAQQAVASLSSSAGDSVAHVTIEIPGALVQVLKDNPGLLGPMVPGAGGGFPGPPGAPGSPGINPVQ